MVYWTPHPPPRGNFLFHYIVQGLNWNLSTFTLQWMTQIVYNFDRLRGAEQQYLKIVTKD